MQPRLSRVRRRIISTAAVSALVAGTAIAASTPAFADSGNIPTTLTGSSSLASVTLTAGQPSDTVYGTLDLGEDMSWNQPAIVGVSWDPDQVRQGRHLDPTDSFARPASGTMSVTYSATGTLHLNTADFGTLDMSVSQSITTTGTCSLLADGLDYGCHLESGSISIFDPSIYSPPGVPYLSLDVTSDVTVSVQALDTLRTASTPSQVLGQAGLTLSETPITDALTVGCRIPAGDALTYQLGDFSTSRGVQVVTGLELVAGVMAPTFAPLPAPQSFHLQLVDNTYPLGSTDGTIVMSGPGGSVAMGNIKPNNIPPTLGAISISPNAKEGVPVQFSTSATGPCADGATYSWDFGDGSGPGHTATPQHTYGDNGTYTGQVVVTDTTGLKDTRDFTVVVANQAPNLSVVPDNPVSVAWGRPLTLQAQAVDPGSADQSTLTYAWDFGDGDTVSGGGPSVTHQWATPGTPSPSVTVCDKDGGCTSRTFDVTVRQRTTSLSYTGPHSGTWSAASPLSASLVDEFGNPVNGAQVDFTLGGAGAGSATTNASGVANRSYVVTQSAGSYLVSAAYAGSALYGAASTGDQGFGVSVMASTLTYTGGLSGGPNKVTNVSAKLVDALGRPLAGKVVTFVIGTQSTTGTTDATGVATGSIKLTQKPGWYPLSASWSGTAGQLAGDSAAAQFTINKK